MPLKLESITWNDSRPVREIVGQMGTPQVDLLLTAREGNPNPQAFQQVTSDPATLSLRVFLSIRSIPAIAFRDSRLPDLLKLISVFPDSEATVIIPSQLLRVHSDVVSRSTDLFELVVRLTEAGCDVDWIDSDLSDLGQRCPELSTPSSIRGANWMKNVIRHIRLPGGDSTAIAALQAGLFLLNDFFEDSHSCSQSIEGRGPHHTGDYWHAILHRREPDYSNSKYWFRHVGRHPVFAELGENLKTIAPSISTEISGRLNADGSWDPFGFVDLCAKAQKDPDIDILCRRVQYFEMLRLLNWTWEEGQSFSTT